MPSSTEHCLKQLRSGTQAADVMTLLTFGMLVFAASVASYGLCLFLGSRKSRGFVVAGLSIGTLLLMAAATLVVLSTNSWLLQRFTGNEITADVEERARGNPSPGPSRVPSVSDEAARTAAIDQPVIDDQHRASTLDERNKNGATRPLERTHRDSIPKPTGASNAERNLLGAPARTSSQLRSTDPWAATTCVVAIQPDPAEPTRWLLENECGTAVAILFSARESDGWKYPAHAMLLPAKHERFTRQAEETQHGEEIRYLACTISAVSISRLIIERPDARSENVWRNELAAAQEIDECLARVERLAASGQRSGLSIDRMLGPGLPGRIRTSSAESD